MATTTQRDTMFRWYMKDNNALNVTTVLNIAGLGLLNDLQNMVVGLNGSTPILISAESIPTQCPRSLMTTGARPDCDESSGYETPQLNITYITTGLQTHFLVYGANLTEWAEIYNASVNNALQTLHAAIRFDLGNAVN
ncbi:hypothetical protein FRB95_007067 [Tulasnella sp. JGI-2019a]|nr:hypothetical protein FRB93_007315 [Tulasnella sp. JGI-2019a]KAG9027905.1 hypothetical protein FRB95_007067 [Tulasnella sp. JGI-2019a]